MRGARLARNAFVTEETRGRSESLELSLLPYLLLLLMMMMIMLIMTLMTKSSRTELQDRVVFSRFSQNREKRLLASSRQAVRPPAWNNSALTGRVLMKFVIEDFFILQKSVQKIQVLLKFDKNDGRFT